jgi:hypothetical protein
MRMPVFGAGSMGRWAVSATSKTKHRGHPGTEWCRSTRRCSAAGKNRRVHFRETEQRNQSVNGTSSDPIVPSRPRCRTRHRYPPQNVGEVHRDLRD